jgi:hypothetical protein
MNHTFSVQNGFREPKNQHAAQWIKTTHTQQRISQVFGVFDANPKNGAMLAKSTCVSISAILGSEILNRTRRASNLTQTRHHSDSVINRLVCDNHQI